MHARVLEGFARGSRRGWKVQPQCKLSTGWEVVWRLTVSMKDKEMENKVWELLENSAKKVLTILVQLGQQLRIVYPSTLRHFRWTHSDSRRFYSKCFFQPGVDQLHHILDQRALSCANRQHSFVGLNLPGIAK